ncbi:MAG: BspA family leucine-rich repeat surface protein, partial [Clostridia bacterium]|nr:BspA family leucine-rich repeat surface protein [Clostridia bacterium]
LSSFNTANVKNMSNMFYNCSSLISVNLNSFRTKNLTTTSNMFSGCSELHTLNLSSFNTKNTVDMSRMFLDCYSLETIYIGSYWSTEKVKASNNMFTNCEKLIGETGFVFDGLKTDKTYASAEYYMTFMDNADVEYDEDRPPSSEENDDYLSNPTQKPESNNSSTSFFQRIIAMIRNFFAKLFKF